MHFTPIFSLIFILLDNFLSERIAYKRAVSEGFAITEYSDKKAKAEFERFFDEFAMKNMNLHKSNVS